MLSTLIFWLLVLLTATSALMVVAARNILRAGFCLCGTFLGVAAMYLFLHADFVAAVQLIVYVGGILVLILFAVMFSSNAAQESGENKRNPLAILAGLVIALVAFAAVVALVRNLNVPLAAANGAAAAPYQPVVSVDAGQTGLGHLLIGRYLLPFEVASMLLLAVLIGAVMIVRKEVREPEALEEPAPQPVLLNKEADAPAGKLEGEPHAH